MSATRRRKKGPAPLDKIFRYRAKGGTFTGEIVAGISMALLSVCGMFMNMQLVLQYVATNYFTSDGSAIAANGEIIAATWFAAMLVAAVGSIVMGLVARLPFVQVSSLSLSTVLASTLSLNTGLSYYNMLAIVFVANIVYLVIAALPQVRALFLDALPKSVRVALPAAAGLLMAWIAAQLSGLFIVGNRGVVAYGSQQMLGQGAALTSGTPAFSLYSFTTDAYHPQMLLSAGAVVLAVVVYLLTARKRKNSPYLLALMVGTLFFLVASILLCGVVWRNMSFSLSFLWARIWMVGAEDAMQVHLGSALASLEFGKIFTEGFDFSAFEAEGGNVALVMASGILNYIFLFLYDAQSTIDACDDVALAETPTNETFPLVINAGTNVLAGLLGSAPVALGKESVAGVRDKARSGLAPVVAGIVFAISAFVWIIPALFATITSYTIQFNMYGHYGKVLQLLTMCSFSVVDAVMMIVGLSMAARALEKGLSGSVDRAPFIATVAGTLFLSNIALGVACGVIAHVLINASKPARKKGQPKVGLVERLGGVPTCVLAAVMLVVLVAALA